MPPLSSQLTCVVAVTGWYADKAISATPKGATTNPPCIPVIPTRWATTPNSRFLTSLQESGLASRGSDASGGCDVVCHQYITGPTNLGHAVVPMLASLRGGEGGSEIKAVNLVVADLEVLSTTKVVSLITSIADYVLVVDVGHAVKNDEAADKKRLLLLTNAVLPSAIAARATILGLVSKGGGDLIHGILRKAADQGEDLPYHHVEVGEDVSPDHMVRAVLPGLLFDALPELSCFPPARTDVLPAERVLRFLDQRSDCTAGENVCMRHATISADDLVLQGGGLDVVVGSLMPVLKINYQLRASLPFRCVLVSHFSQRQVALVYIVQGTLRCGESLMSANLHLMGVLGDETPNVINWSALRQDCRVETMSRYPIPHPMVGEDDVALPGEFVTLQLQRGLRHVQATTAVDSEPSTVVSAPQPTKKPRAAKAAPSGCFLENLTTWSICGKLPAMNGGNESVDTVFPRPFAVAQWSLSNIYREAHSSALPGFDTKTFAYTGGTQHLANATVVGGEAHILSSTPHELDDAGKIVSLNVADQSSEATFDTHVHLLDPRMPFPERRALLVFSDYSVVVRTTVIQRKLTLLMAAAAGAVRAFLGPPLPSSLRIVATVEDVVERIGIRAGTKVPLPVGAAVQKMVREAAGHELTYHLPTGLLVELGVFDASRFITEGSTIYDALMHPKFLSNVPSEVDIRSGRFVTPKDTVTQETPTPPVPAPIGVWALLAMSYHSCCEQGYKGDAIKMSQSLRSATNWAQSISSTSNPYLMYMMARPKGVKRVGPSQCHVRAAMGPAFLFNLSSHTRHLWNKYVGDTVPFETVWRAVLPRLLSEWNAGSTYEPILWLRMLFNSSLALDTSRSVDVGFSDCCQLLLRSSGQPSQEALAQMILLMGRHISEYKLMAYRCRTWTLPIVGNIAFGISPPMSLYPSDIFTGGGVAACGVSDPIIGLLYEWYSAVGGVRALGAPLFERIQLDDKFEGRPPYNFTQAQLKGHHLHSSVIPRQMPIQVPRKPFTLKALNAARANGLVDKAPDEDSRRFTLVSLVQLHLYLAASATKSSYAALTVDAVSIIADYLP